MTAAVGLERAEKERHRRLATDRRRRRRTQGSTGSKRASQAGEQARLGVELLGPQKPALGQYERCATLACSSSKGPSEDLGRASQMDIIMERKTVYGKQMARPG
jgi:hypothetical protein